MTSGDCIRVVHPLFREEGDGSIPSSPLQLEIVPVGFEYALRLNELWHSRLPRMGTGFVKVQPFLSFAAMYQGIAYAIAIWSNPVARNLPQQEWLELRRLAVAPDAPLHTCSRMLAIMARLIRRYRPHVNTLVSYSDTEAHRGTIYKAAGWRQTATNRDGNWTRRKRPRPEAQSAAPKLRWEKTL
jgi:hypothetical protein